MMSEKRRMHPAAIAVSVLKRMKSIVLPFLFLVFLAVKDGETLGLLIFGAGLVVVFAATTGWGVAEWYRFYYWVEDGELRIENGVFVRQRRYIPQERIQTIDTSEGIIQRMFGLVKVQVETAGGGTEAEAVLSAVTKEEAERLRDVLLKKGPGESVVDVMDGDPGALLKEREISKPTYTISWRSLFLVGTTSGGIGVVLSAVVAFISQLDQFVSYEDVVDRFDLVVQTSVYFIASVAFFVLFLAWMISIAMTMIKYGNFTVVKQGDELLISRGIIEKRQLTIPLGRIQAIRISQNLLRQPFGLATVYVESAGGAGGKESDFATILFPLVNVKEVSGLLQEFTPEYIMQKHIQPLPKRSLPRYLIRLVLPALLVSSVVSYFFQPYGFFSFILVGLAGALGYGQYKAGGWNVRGSQLQLSYRLVNKNIVLVHRKRVQAFEWKESEFQKRRQLQTINASIKSSVTSKSFRVVDVEKDDSVKIFDWYTYEKKQG
ncbi:putative membrane protein [Bacillus tianshenii]|uniref:Membrane protein n=1 Tax=Sutcliffiella tianshenii TaxID=1463404 RepID=A0ABS2P423_9BACI|nr:PH domain-containing protein [Bacillus tianshenii]MBM7621675.1 putative membrane protein [Bacillus tianshenii]